MQNLISTDSSVLLLYITCIAAVVPAVLFCAVLVFFCCRYACVCAHLRHNLWPRVSSLRYCAAVCTGWDVKPSGILLCFGTVLCGTMLCCEFAACCLISRAKLALQCSWLHSAAGLTWLNGLSAARLTLLLAVQCSWHRTVSWLECS